MGFQIIDLISRTKTQCELPSEMEAKAAEIAWAHYSETGVAAIVVFDSSNAYVFQAPGKETGDGEA